MIEKIDNIYKKVENYIKNNLPLILVFTLIFVLLFFQHNVLAMYFDDFGNASLSYGQDSFDIAGTNYTLSQLFSWDAMIYNTWGGRILYATTILIPLLKHGVGLYFALQAVVITLIFYFIYKIVKEITNYKSILIPIVLFILYTLIDMIYLRHGIYWASASILYIWPLMPLFAFIYLFIKLTKKIKNNEKVNYLLYTPIMVILNFFASFSQEQIGVATLAFIILYIALEHRKDFKKYLKLDIVSLVVCLLGVGLLLGAPGNYARLDTNTDFSSLSVFGKVALNYPEIIKNIFKDKMVIYTMAFTILFMFNLIKNNSKMKISKKAVIISSSIFTVFTILSILLQRFVYVNTIVIYGTIWLLYIGIWFIIYYAKTNRAGVIALPISGCGSIFCLVLSPVVGGRTCLPFIFYLFLLIVLTIAEIIKDSKNIYKIIAIILILITGLIGIKKYYKIYMGYTENYGLEKYNYDKLDNYKDEDGKVVNLYKYPNIWYGSTRSYQEPSMDFWIKEYFDINQDVEFNWIDIYEVTPNE